MKHFPNEKDLATNIFNLKFTHHVTSDHAEMVFFLGHVEYTNQGI